MTSVIPGRREAASPEAIATGQRIWIPDLPLSRQSGMTSTLSSPPDSTHIGAMPPKQRDPAKHSKKDPAKPTRAKASRPDAAALDDSLADLLNPAIGQGTAGLGLTDGTAAAAGQFLGPPRRFRQCA